MLGKIPNLPHKQVHFAPSSVFIVQQF